MVGGSTKGYFLYNVVEKLKENPSFSVTFFELFLKHFLYIDFVNLIFIFFLTQEKI